MAPVVEPDIDVFFSDTTLLIISLLGFTLVAVTLYVLVIRNLGTSAGVEDDEDQQQDYDQTLAEADVSTLNRAQRRARAKNRMKKNRRAIVQPVQRPAAPVAADGEEAGDGAADDDDDDDVGGGPAFPTASRKERQRAAKAAEREERRRYTEEARLRREADASIRSDLSRGERDARLEEEERVRQAELEKASSEQAEHESWRVMFPADKHIIDDIGGTVKEGRNLVTVREFLAHVKKQKVISIDDVASEFGVAAGDVLARLTQLVNEGRIMGIIDDRGNFIHVTTEEMKAVAECVRQRGRITTEEIAKEIDMLLELNGDVE